MLFAAPAPPPCVPAGASVVAVRGRAAVYSQLRGRFGCYGAGKPVTLLTPLPAGTGPVTGRPTLRRITLHGRFVAFARTNQSVDVANATVEVYDLRARRRIEHHRAVQPVSAPSTDDVGGLRLRIDGAVAWIATVSIIGVPGTGAAVSPPGGASYVREVHAARGGHARLLDSSATIVVHSLRLSGRLVLWRDGGVSHQAAL